MSEPMRVRVLSDVHLEFGAFVPPKADADVVVLAGDIGCGIEGVRWAARSFPGIPCIYVPGNHEFYGSAVQDILRKLAAEAKALGIELLNDSLCTIGGVRFLGSTLWTDFNLLGDRPRALAVAGSSLSDFRRIRVAPRYRRLRPEDTWGWHDRAVRWLRSQFLDDTPTVVVTHHAPTIRSVAEHHRQDPLCAAFASALDEVVAQSAAKLWIHGHTHRSVDFRINRTRVLSNQRGYLGDPDPRFDPALVVEV
ncbi:MAG: metallophosphoesterase [Phycisphaerales bacterium]|nr:metallophosphoesterase [Phycisphaerales bacterium]